MSNLTTDEMSRAVHKNRLMTPLSGTFVATPSDTFMNIQSNNMTNDDINSKIGINLKSAKRNSKLSTFSKNRSCRK